MQKVLEGFHATIFAYGQTGSGKTYIALNIAAMKLDSAKNTILYVTNNEESLKVVAGIIFSDLIHKR